MIWPSTTTPPSARSARSWWDGKFIHFFGSDTGGRTAAILYSLTASAKRHSLDPFIYLRDILATIGATPMSQLDQFLPDHWQAQQLKEIAAG